MKRYLIIFAVLLAVSFMPVLVNPVFDLSAAILGPALDRADKEDMRRLGNHLNGFERLDLRTQRRLLAAGVTRVNTQIAGAAGEGRIINE